MSDLLRAWLAEEIGLPVSDNIERDFASGYLFGQLLNKYNLQPDLDHFDPKRMPDSMINNYTRLQPTFKKLGVHLDTRVVNMLIREETGVAPRLLYSIKQNVSHLQKSLSMYHHTGNLGRTVGASVSPSRTLLDAQKHNTSKEKYDTSAHRQFEELLRLQAANPNMVMESIHLSKFADEGLRQQREALATLLRERAQQTAQRDALRSTQMEKMSSARSEKAQKLARDDAVHAALLKRKEEMEREELRVELALSEKARRKKLEELHHAALDVHGGIDAFEINMKRLVRGDQGEGEFASPGDYTKGEEVLAPPAGKTPVEHMEQMKSRAAATAKLLEDTAAYMRGVKEARAEDVASKREREARRRKMVVEQQAAAATAERKAQVDALVSALQRQSAEEQRLAARLWQVSQEKEVMRENRLLRERQYAERRERDWEETLRREAEMHRSMREAYEAEAALEMEAWRAAQQARAEAKAAKHAAFAREVVYQLVGLAERAAEYRLATGNLVPRREWRQWLAMFAAGDPQLGMPPPPPGSEAQLAEADAREATSRLGRALVGDYLACTGDWVREQGPIGHDELLGQVVGELAIQSREPAPQPELPAIENLPLRLAVVGAPFSGKTTVAQDLARKYRLLLLDPEALVADAMAAAQAHEAAVAAAATAAAAPPVPPASSQGSRPLTPASPAAAAVAAAAAAAAEAAAAAAAAGPSVKAQLGAQVAAALQAGGDVPDEALVRLVILGMKEAAEWVPPVQADPKAKTKGSATKASAATSGKAAAAAAGATAAQQQPPGNEQRGFVVDGFPRTAAQAVLLERMLTGLDLESEQALIDSASTVAPPPSSALPQVGRPLVSGLDAVIVCDLADPELALKRALGRRLDPDTGRVFHLEFDPPPANDPGLSARLKEVADVSNDAQQIQHRLASQSELAATLDDWLRRFSRLRRPVDGTGPLAEVLASASDIAEGLLRAKAAAASCRAAAEAAHKARASAEQAHEFAELAQSAAESAARELLAAKRAEIQATALLNSGKNPDPAATEVLKAQAAAKCAEQLKVARGAVTDANSHAERAATSAAAAAEAVERAHKSLGDAEVSAHAESEAAAAATEAEKAARGAQEAASKALAAKEAAAVAAAEAERLAAATELPSESSAAAVSRPTTVPSGATTVAATEGAAAATAVGADGAEATAAAEVAAPQPPVLPRPLAGSLLSEWQTVEQCYLDGLSLGFTSLAEQHAAAQRHFDALRQNFRDLLQRPDEKPALVARFLTAFNAVEADLRGTRETRGELMLRCEELRDQLWALCDRKMEEAEAQRAAVAADSFVADHCSLLAQQFVALAQVEADRFAASLNFLRSYANAKWAPLFAPREPPMLADVSAPDLLSGGVPLELKDKIDPKSKTAVAMPPWIAQLEQRAPPLALACKLIIALAKTTYASWEPAPDDPKKAKRDAGAKVASKGKGKGADEDDAATDPRVVEAMTQELLTGCGREVAILEARLGLMAERCMGQMDEIYNLATGTAVKLGEWIRARYRAECAAVAALEKVSKAAAAGGEQLQHDLRLQDEYLLLDEGGLLVDAPPPLPRPEPREAQPPGGLLSTKQLGAVTAAFLSAAPSGFMRLQDAAEMLCRLAAEGALPEPWRSASVSSMLGALRLYDPLYSTYLDWREVVAHLVVAAFPLIARADCAEIADQVDICAEVDKDKDGLLSQEEWSAAELWFQYRAAQPGAAPSSAAPASAAGEPASESHRERSELAEAQQLSSSGGKGTGASGNGGSGGHTRGDGESWPDPSAIPPPSTPPVDDGQYDSPGALKQVLWALFSSPSADGTPRLDYRACLLYLCADRDAFAGIKKAFSVVTANISSNARANAEQVLRIAYPLGAEAGIELHRSPFSHEEVAAVVRAVWESRNPPKPPAPSAGSRGATPPSGVGRAGGPTAAAATAGEPTVTAEQLMYSAGGERFVKRMLERYAWKDSFVATRL
ncbi:hypothetical protein VOLCADRAFT_103155 [Volvox carteri f. nagariensis]|uniref:Calponin-homology (CH) domain-containing protein n=1 Tax=Volvox carteri f. nagariensis TaxID=3068 RepID=D8TJV4_VOLCA|nr:uncharacterized protein VOLCADRAFT_103155 [Volvox carteri f. nagariensis]EFJ52136.1 hypothetical protein VOLCADRAFT_103155 [Volvox carteri f. nagariensis]|eukprot:XP_002946910.1 hypothetical protein VOLCADRAFT_103155 [Volvox carteri f. nagariensis]